jgi:hypothetical protein
MVLLKLDDKNGNDEDEDNIVDETPALTVLGPVDEDKVVAPGEVDDPATVLLLLPVPVDDGTAPLLLSVLLRLDDDDDDSEVKNSSTALLPPLLLDEDDDTVSALVDDDNVVENVLLLSPPLLSLDDAARPPVLLSVPLPALLIENELEEGSSFDSPEDTPVLSMVLKLDDKNGNEDSVSVSVLLLWFDNEDVDALVESVPLDDTIGDAVDDWKSLLLLISNDVDELSGCTPLDENESSPPTE